MPWVESPAISPDSSLDIILIDRDHARFFSFYRDIGAVLYPVLADVTETEYNLHHLLRNRAQAGGEYRPDANG